MRRKEVTNVISMKTKSNKSARVIIVVSTVSERYERSEAALISIGFNFKREMREQVIHVTCTLGITFKLRV